MAFDERVDRIADIVDRPLWYACWVLLVGATLLAFAAVVMRYGFGIGYIWLDEVCRYSFIAMVYLWAGPIVRKGEHIRLEVFTSRLGKRATVVHSLIVNVLIGFTCIIIAVWGLSLIQMSKMLTEKSESFVFYIWWLHTLVAVGMGLHAFYSLLEILKAVTKLLGKADLTEA
jgi:TRAP-type C4-dicarboxylate transport system permease small subunit